ncbi:MAG TPA: helix-turn-helix domain-containing protein, partial [Jatrophihabitans sp.]|nr:helix-turn-helix domain-containing protein [Jatrophihabitans sp.]
MTRIVQPTSGAIRAANRASLVQVLRHAGSATRAELAVQTGLSRATVSSLLGELADRGLISERRCSDGREQGRPAAKVALNRSAGIAIAV